MRGAHLPSTEPLVRAAQTGLRAALVVIVAGWMFDLPGRMGTALYTEQYLALVMGLCTAMVLLEAGGRSPLVQWASVAFAAAVLALFSYVAVHYPQLQLSLALAPPSAVALGLLMIAGVLEATRRKTGPFLPILVCILAGFAFVGPYLPDAFQTRPVSFSRLVVYLSLDTNALFGKVLVIASVVVVPFIVFGFLLNAFGGSAFFAGLAAALVGRYKGGPAKVSVVGSGAFGMVSGSAVANVVAVGSMSIPMMTRAGYARHVAAGIEAVSSTGGQLMPPIMGASAFLMAELLEIPYQSIVVAAVLPALLYYVALFLAVDFEARRLNIGGGSAEDSPFSGGRRIEGWRFLLPVGVLLYLLFVEKRTAEFAGVYSVVALIAVHLLYPLRDVLGRLKQVVVALLESMGAISDIILIAAAAGLIIGVLNVTGVSFAITLQMLAVSQNSLPLLLLLTAALCILLGLGMPTVGVYVLLATLAAPALIQLQIEPLAAHFYVLYFGMLSMITPPIAIASFAAASVAGCDPWKTAFSSVRVGLGVFLVPLAFVLQPELLFIGDFTDTLVAAARTLLSVALVTAVAVGYVARPLGLPVRLLGGAMAVANVLPLTGSAGDVALWAAFAAGAGLMLFAVRTRAPVEQPVEESSRV